MVRTVPVSSSLCTGTSGMCFQEILPAREAPEGQWIMQMPSLETLSVMQVMLPFI